MMVTLHQIETYPLTPLRPKTENKRRCPRRDRATTTPGGYGLIAAQAPKAAP